MSGAGNRDAHIVLGGADRIAQLLRLLHANDHVAEEFADPEVTELDLFHAGRELITAVDIAIDHLYRIRAETVAINVDRDGRLSGRLDQLLARGRAALAEEPVP